MTVAKLEKTLLVTAKNEIGVAADVSALLSQKGVNLRAICGWGEGAKGTVMVVPENTDKAREALKNSNYQVSDQEVVLIEVPHRVGSLTSVAEKIKKAGININFIYATADKSGKYSLIVINGADNRRILQAIG